MIDDFLLLLQFVLAATLAWSSFCRMVRMDNRTREDVRLAIWAQGLAAAFVAGGPFMPLVWDWPTWEPGHTPVAIWLGLLAACTAVQVVTSRLWRGGVPADYTRKS
jgi:hypothetical protein